MKKIYEIKNNESPKDRHYNEKILFLGYGPDKTKIIDAMKGKVHEIWHTEEEINNLSGFDVIIIFGYRYILKKDVINTSSCPIVNLHISYLPYNRGSHPNFWSFFDGTPSGVSIHLIDEGIDTGPILFQKYVNFKENEVTFKDTYNRLISEMENFFVEHIDEIITKSYKPIYPLHKGTYHKMKELPVEFKGWDSVISEEIPRLQNILESRKKEKLSLIDEIEKIRTSNNVNWMDLLRLAIKSAPDDAMQLIRKINSDDNQISALFAKLGE